MQYLYVRRRFSGWGLQLGLSEGLLLSGAGLAVALLLYTAATSSAATGTKWKATSHLAAIPLVTSPPNSAKAPLISLVGEPQPYWAATAVAYQGLAAPAPSPDLSEQNSGFNQASSSPANTLQATMYRCWTIIKLAFR